MEKNLTDAQNRTPVFAVPQNAPQPPQKEGTALENVPDTPAEDIPAVRPPKATVHPAEKWAVGLCPLLGWLYVRILLYGDSVFDLYARSFDAGYRPWPAGFVFTVVFVAAALALALAWSRRPQNAARAGAPRAEDTIPGAAPMAEMDAPPVSPAKGRLAALRARLPGEGPLWMGCTLLVGTALAFGGLRAVPPALAVLLWHLFAGYGVLALTGQLTENRTGPLCVADGLRGIGRGFAGLWLWPLALGQLGAEARGRRRQKLLPALLAVLVSLLLLTMAAGWLSNADETFAAILERLAFWRDWHWDLDILWQLTQALLVGAFLFGLGVGGRRALAARPRPTLQRYRQSLAGLQVLSSRLLCGLLAVFCGLYLVFFAVQGGYLFGGLVGRLPDGFTIAGYARQGFFELCRVMLLNFCLLALVAATAARPLRSQRGLRTAAALLLGESLLLWLTAAAKLGLYIFTFGFTAKRLLAAWMLLVLAVAAARTLLWLQKPYRILRPTVLTGAVTLALLCQY